MSGRILSVITLLCASGCTEIAGAGEYRIGDSFAPDPPIENRCGADEVLTDDGMCEHVGVPAEVCEQDEFELATDGACAARLPDTDCITGLAYPGLRSCDLALADIDTCLDGYPSIAGLNPDSIVYVDAEAPMNCADPRGSRACPHSTIGAALTAIQIADTASGTIVFVKQGTYREDVAIVTSGVELRGCAGKATIIGQKTGLAIASSCAPLGYPISSAALCVAPGTTNVRLIGLRVQGPALGIAVAGAELTLQKSEISDTESHGLLVMEAKTAEGVILPSSAALLNVAVLGAGGAGIVAIGSRLTMDQSSIQGTRALRSAPDELELSQGEQRIGWARGLSVYPSMWTSNPEYRGDPEDFAQSNVTVTRSAITGNEELAVFAAGATLTLKDSFVGALPQGASSGRGLVIERSFSVGTPVSATVERSVFERTRDAAIDVRDGSLTLADTTIRDTSGRRGDACAGQGLRVRTMPPGDAQSVVNVERSTILNSRQSAMFAASSLMSVKSTLLRDIAPEGSEPACIAGMGDGITFEAYPGAPAPTLELDRVKIEGAERAALSAASDGISLASSVLACSDRHLVDVTTDGNVETKGRALCGCGDEWRVCETTPELLVPWSCAGPSVAWPDASRTLWFCGYDFNTGSPLGAVSLWSIARPEVVPTFTDNETGCAHLTGLFPEWETVAFWKTKYFSRTRDLDEESAQLFSGLTQLSQNITRIGRPWGVPQMLLTQVAAGSIVVVEPKALIFDGNGTLLADGTPLPGTVGTRIFAFAAVSESGWYRVSIVPPDGWVCSASGFKIAGEDPTAQYVRADYGMTPSVGYRCEALQ